MACCRFGVGFDDDAGIWVLLLRVIQHLAEGVQVAVTGFNRGVTFGLVDNHHVARVWGWGGWIEGVIF